MKCVFKNIVVLLILIFCSISSNGQSLPTEITNLSRARDYLKEHITELDPIEGVFEMENEVVTTSSYYAPKTITQKETLIILDIGKIDDRNYKEDSYIVYSMKQRGVIGVIEKLSYPYYRLLSADGSGNQQTNSIKLEYGASFKVNEVKYNGTAKTTKNSIFIKSYPTDKMYQEAISAEKAKNSVTSGTGFFLSNDGYIVTNYHVIENAQNGNIKVTGINDNNISMYPATVKVVDKQNDLAILKVEANFNKSQFVIPYTIRYNTASTGEDCFVLGYPLISSMGKDIKLTNGIISSKTGFDGNIAQYQISAPIQPGNSGGPLFDKDGNVIGIVQAKHTQAENAGYAIKSSYILNLIDLLPTSIEVPSNNQLKGKSLTQQVEQASKYICIIIVNGK